jgi:hypothetical protein
MDACFIMMQIANPTIQFGATIRVQPPITGMGDSDSPSKDGRAESARKRGVPGRIEAAEDIKLEFHALAPDRYAMSMSNIANDGPMSIRADDG